MGLREDSKKFLEEKGKKIEEIQNKINVKLKRVAKIQKDKSQLKNEIEKEFDEDKLKSIRNLNKDLSEENEGINILNINKKNIQNEKLDCPVDLVRKEVLKALKEKEVKKQFDNIAKAKEEYTKEVYKLYALTGKIKKEVGKTHEEIKNMNLNIIKSEDDNFKIDRLSLMNLNLFFSTNDLFELENKLLSSDVNLDLSYDILKNYK